MVLAVLVAGAFLGKAVGELVDAVKAEGKKISTFKSILKSIESTLEMITPHLEDITRLDQILNRSGVGINALVALVGEGKDCVDKCSKVSLFNFVKVRKNHKLLAEFESNLLRYFVTVLQLELFKDARETLLLLKDVHRELIPAVEAEIKEIELTPVIKAEIGEIEESVQAYNDLEMKDGADGSSFARKRRDDQAYYDKPVMTREERARGALRTKTAGNKKENVLIYVDSLKRDFGDGLSTKCIIYNATGETVNLVDTHDWTGNIGPVHYPLQIENGQWGGFLHVNTAGSSSGAVVYRGRNLKDEYNDWMLSWSNPRQYLFQQKRVYNEIRQACHYEQNHWDHIRGILNSSGTTHKEIWNGCSSSMTYRIATPDIYEVYTEVRAARPHEQDLEGYIRDIFNRSGEIHKDNCKGCSSSMTSGIATTDIFEAKKIQSMAFV